MFTVLSLYLTDLVPYTILCLSINYY